MRRPQILIYSTVIILILVLIGTWWWNNSNFVTYQEYKPTSDVAGLLVTDMHILITSSRHNHSKRLLLNLGSEATLLEQDDSVYSKHLLTCVGHITDCRILTTPMSQQLEIVLLRPATNLPATKMTVEAIKGHTDIILTENTTSPTVDKDISTFFDSLQPFNY